MSVHWYVCRNKFCKNYNRDFSLVFGAVEYGEYAPKLECPFCHSDNIVRTKQNAKNFKLEQTSQIQLRGV